MILNSKNLPDSVLVEYNICINISLILVTHYPQQQQKTVLSIVRKLVAYKNYLLPL